MVTTAFEVPIDRVSFNHRGEAGQGCMIFDKQQIQQGGFLGTHPRTPCPAPPLGRLDSVSLRGQGSWQQCFGESPQVIPMSTKIHELVTEAHGQTPEPESMGKDLRERRVSPHCKALEG